MREKKVTIFSILIVLLGVCHSFSLCTEKNDVFSCITVLNEVRFTGVVLCTLYTTVQLLTRLNAPNLQFSFQSKFYPCGGYSIVSSMLC